MCDIWLCKKSFYQSCVTDFDHILLYYKQLLVDKDTVMSAVTSSHDAHMLKIDNKEDDIVTRIKGWLKDMIETIHNEEEIKRNRTRVIEINNLIDFLNAELDNIDVFSGR